MKQLLLVAMFFLSGCAVAADAENREACTKCEELQNQISHLRDEIGNNTLHLNTLESDLYAVSRQAIKIEVDFDERVLKALKDYVVLPKEESSHDDKCEGCESIEHDK